MIGGWAVEIGQDIGQGGTALNAAFATYSAATGVIGLESYNIVGAGNAGNVFTLNGNTHLTGNQTLQSGGATINSLTMTGGLTLTFSNPTDTLVLQSGGLLSGFDGNNRTVGASAGQGNLTASSGQSELFLHNGANTLTINSNIINNGQTGGLNVVLDGLSENPTITLAGNNTYTGTTFINGVNVNLSTPIANGTTITAIPGNVVISGGTSTGQDSALASTYNTTTLTLSNEIASTANVTLNGGSILSLGANSNTIANLTLNADGGSNSNIGPVLQTGAGTLTLTGGITTSNLNWLAIPVINGNLNLTAGAHTVQIGSTPAVPALSAALLSPQVGLLPQVGLELNSTITGTGSLNVVSDGMGVGVLGLGASTVNAETITLGANTTLTIAGNSVTMGGLNSTVTTSTLTGLVGGQLSVGNDNSNSSFAGLVTGPINLVKAGSGSFQLTNPANNFTGNTYVNAGSFLLGGAGVNASGQGTVYVNNGASLGGSGIATALQFNAVSSDTIALPATATSPPQMVAGTLAVNGLTTINITGSATAGTQYELLGYGNASALTSGQFANFQLGTTPGGAGLYYGLVNDTANKSVDVIVQSTGASLTWVGQTSNTWDTTSVNWTPGGIYSNGTQVTFNDTGNTGPVESNNVTISGPAVQPQAITVNTSTINYTLANPIGGAVAGGLTKNGTSTLTLTGNNTFTGPTTINAVLTGSNTVVSVFNNGTGSVTQDGLGSSPVTLANNTTLQLNLTASTAANGLTGRTIAATGSFGGSSYTVVANFNQPAADTRTYFATGGATIGGAGNPNNAAFFTAGPSAGFRGPIHRQAEHPHARQLLFPARQRRRPAALYRWQPGGELRPWR